MKSVITEYTVITFSFDGISFAPEPGQGQMYMFLDTFLPVAVPSKWAKK